MAEKQKYFNVPIQLFKGFLVNSSNVLNNVVQYACYEYAVKNACNFGDAGMYYDVSFTNFKAAERNGKALYNSLPTNSPKVGLGYTLWHQYLFSDKTDFDKACLLAYLSIKSILQQKAFMKIDNDYFLSRMDGNPIKVERFDLSSEIKKYANEYQTVKLKKALRNNWGLVYYARFTRGFFIAFKDRVSLEQLIMFAETKRISTKEKQYKQVEKDTYLKVMERLKST